MLKSILLTSVILLSYTAFFGQSVFPYDAEWKLIDSLINKKNLPKSALVEVNKLYAAAKKEKQEAQWVKAILYINYLQESDDRDLNQRVLAIEKEISAAPPRVAAILKSVEAEQLYNYLQDNRYGLRNRTAILSDTSGDMTGWTIDRVKQKIRDLYLSSIGSPALLQQTTLNVFDPVLLKGNVREYRPSLFDLLSYRALDYFRIDDPEQSSFATDSLMDDPALFSEASYFTTYGFTASDSLSNALIALKIFQQLLRFHVSDSSPDAFIDADISRIRFAYQGASMPAKDSLYLGVLDHIIYRFPALAVTDQAVYLEAQWWAKQAGTFDPLKDSSHRYDYLKAIALCETVVSKPGVSAGKSDCEILLRNIRSSSFSIQSETVNIPGHPFRLLVSYKNIHQLYGRIIRIDDTLKDAFRANSYNLKSWTRWIRLPYEKKFDQVLPETSDYQNHRVEIKMEAQPVGQYALLTSSDPDFSDTAILGLSTFFNSSIAFVSNGMHYFVVDRDTGHPMKGVKVKSFYEKYTNTGTVFKPEKSFVTDLNGHFRLLTENKNTNNYKLEFYSGKDYFSTVNYFNQYYRNRTVKDETDPAIFEKAAMKDYLFMDRSIYRPGQIVFFKGLIVTRDFNSKKYKVVARHQAKIYLVNANDENIDSLMPESNDFGSVQGSFKLPENQLNGSFRIIDGTTEDASDFSVEEYKRPTFYIMYDSLKDSYKVGGVISVKGAALAYAGNPIDNAKLSWRVYRETRFPYPWLFRYFPSNSEQEISHGESMTDETGKFNIGFTALPDKSVKQTVKPVYTYRVEATVTDANGETRSETSSVSVSYQSFEISSTFPDQGRISRDSLYQLPVTTRNLAGIFIKEKLTVNVFPLAGPGRLIRKRYWEQPDQFVLSEAEYVKAFPFDEYKNETDIDTWKPGASLFEKTDSTRSDGFFAVGNKVLTTLEPGWYVFEFKSTDRDGELIIDKKYIELTANGIKSNVLSYNLVPVEMKSAEPGDQVKIRTGSDARNLFVIRSRQSMPDTASAFSFYKLDQQLNSTVVEIRESDRGGFAINDAFVKNNRWYSSGHTIVVPWTNKELQITYQTWKDKTQPGSKEQWKIKISGYKKDSVSAEILTSMYDASLDQFRMHSWTPPGLYPIYQQNNPWMARNIFDDASSTIRPRVSKGNDAVIQNRYDEILGLGNLERMLQGRVAGLQIRSMATFSANQSLDEVGTASGIKRQFAPVQIEMAKFSPPKIVKDEESAAEAKPPSTEKTESANGQGNVQIRKNFSETAFFKPDLQTDSAGNVEISFTMPDALTRWKWMVLANTKDLSYGYSEKMLVTQKELMLQTNMPRFFREGDTMLLPVKMASLSTIPMTGTVQLEWINSQTNINTDQAFGNDKNIRSFSIPAGQSSVVYFPVSIPSHFTQPVLYRIIAKTDTKSATYSDGEENMIPVLSNRMLVTESLPLNLMGADKKDFVFEKLLKSASARSLQNQSLTVEYTTNPAWYAVQSLPYLMEFPYECAEQTFNRFYANALASHIVKLSPSIEAVFEKWKNTDTAALLSNLQKNEELKTVLLRETPWVLEAQSETQQKKNLALLFDLVKMQKALKSALDKLKSMQSENGGFPWFKGGRDDQYITSYILSGIGRLKKLNAIPAAFRASLDQIAKSGMTFLDQEIRSDYEKRYKSSKTLYLEADKIQYLYMRSFFPEIPVPASVSGAYNFFRKLSVAQWMKQPVFMQGMIALSLNRTGDPKTAKDILASLKENATVSQEIGMYWKSNQYGYSWSEAPVETQSVFIETFQELRADRNSIDQMKYWLLQQKHTQHWPTTKATADACYALLLSGSDWLATKQEVNIQLGNYTINSADEKSEAGTGYFKKRISGDQVKPEMGNIEVTIHPQGSIAPPSTVNRQPSTPSWGAIYWQYFENLDKITTAQTSLSMSRKLFIERNAGKGPVLEAVSNTNSLKPGDKLILRIFIKTDRDLEYVHLKDMRAACLEPVNILSGYQWQGGLGYYQTTQDVSTSFFFDRMPKGEYVFEYPVFVTTAGNYSNGISTLECMYAPEFAAHSEGIRIQVVSK